MAPPGILGSEGGRYGGEDGGRGKGSLGLCGSRGPPPLLLLTLAPLHPTCAADRIWWWAGEMEEGGGRAKLEQEQQEAEERMAQRERPSGACGCGCGKRVYLRTTMGTSVQFLPRSFSCFLGFPGASSPPRTSPIITVHYYSQVTDWLVSVQRFLIGSEMEVYFRSMLCNMHRIQTIEEQLGCTPKIV